MITEKDALTAAQGDDTMDLLDHIAWTDVIKPRLQEARNQLTTRLVNATLFATKGEEESREQIAGKLYGINWIENELKKVISAGRMSKERLAEQNIFIR